MPVLSYSGRTYNIYTDTMPSMTPLAIGLPSGVECKGRIALQAGHASPVKWCLNEKVELLFKLAMPRLSKSV